MSFRLLLVPLALAAGCAVTNPYERTLANGLRVIFKKHNRAPNRGAHLVWYRVGSMDGKNVLTGIAHVLEHVMYNAWAIVGFYRLPETWLADFPRAVERVTAADVRAAFARHVRPERFVTVVVGIVVALSMVLSVLPLGR